RRSPCAWAPPPAGPGPRGSADLGQAGEGHHVPVVAVLLGEAAAAGDDPQFRGALGGVDPVAGEVVLREDLDAVHLEHGRPAVLAGDLDAVALLHGAEPVEHGGPLLVVDV